MRQKVFILLGFVVLVAILIGLNALSYTQKEKIPDSELNPNRSSYNAGVTGTRAFFELLSTGGRRVVRWQQPPSELRSGKNTPSTLIIVGTTRREIDETESGQILEWVRDGGKLVVIDRTPPISLIQSTSDWSLLVSGFGFQNMLTDPSDQAAMTKDVPAMRAVQPTNFTVGVNAVQPSVLVADVSISYAGKPAAQPVRSTPGDVSMKSTPAPKVALPTLTPTPTPKIVIENPNFSTPKPTPTVGGETLKAPPLTRESTSDDYDEDYDEAPLVKTPTPKTGLGSGSGSGPPVIKAPPPAVLTAPVAKPTPPGIQQNAPVVHVAGNGRNLVVDVPYGAGRVVVISDPYIVSNGGINLVDNAQLAINVVNAKDGIIAFDEYHQGFGGNENRLLMFFAGTPVVPVAIQLAMLIGLIFYSQSRRFGRPLPDAEPNRLSKLEYVAAMAELQQRTKGYDLALENIFGDFRRRVARLVGVDAQKVRPRDLALLIAERLPDENAADLELLITQSIDVMQGDATNKKEVLRLTTRIRELEQKLGLQRVKRGRRSI